MGGAIVIFESKALEYKGYAADMSIDWDAGIIFGRVANINDVVTFKGASVAEAAQAFRDSVDDWLEFRSQTIAGMDNDEELAGLLSYPKPPPLSPPPPPGSTSPEHYGW